MNTSKEEMARLSAMVARYEEEKGSVDTSTGPNTNCYSGCAGYCSGGCNNFCTYSCSNYCDNSASTCWKSHYG